MVGLGIAVADTIQKAHSRILPSTVAIAIAAPLAVVAIVASCRTWTALFEGVFASSLDRRKLAGTYYVSQLTKYLPVGGVLQATSQVSLATSLGIPIGRVAVAFPVSALSSVTAGCTLGAGLVFATSLPGWARVLALLGLATPLLMHRTLLANVLALARRIVRRIPAADRLPEQRHIFASYRFGILSISGGALAYSTLAHSLAPDAGFGMMFCAYAVAWVVGFVIVPIPAGIGVREALLVAIVPHAGAGPLLAASLAQRLLAAGAEVGSIVVNRVITRRQAVKLKTVAPSQQRKRHACDVTRATDIWNVSDS